MQTSPSRAPWVVYLLTLASAPVLAAVIAATTPRPPGACTGIGWGCSLYEWDLAGFMLLIMGAPYAVALGAVLLVLTLVLPARAQHVATGVAVVGAAVPWLFVLFVFVASDAP